VISFPKFLNYFGNLFLFIKNANFFIFMLLNRYFCFLTKFRVYNNITL